MSHGSGIVALPAVARGAINAILDTKSFEPKALFALIETTKAVMTWYVLAGVLFILLGLFAIVEPAMAAIGIALLLGWLLILGGIAHLIWTFRGGGTQRVEARAPQRLIGVDVSHPGEGALVEERRLERGAPSRETLAEPRRREERVERLVANALAQVRLRLAGLEQEPGAEAPDVPIRDVRAVV